MQTSCQQTSATKITCQPSGQQGCANPTGAVGQTICPNPQDYFTQATCANVGSIYIWSQNPCPTGQKCLLGACAQDSSQPDCIPGTQACGEAGSLNQNQINTCIQDQQGNYRFIYDGSTQDCQMSGLFCDKGACSSSISMPSCPAQTACGPNGEQAGLRVFECRGGEMVQTEYCEGDTYCQNGQCVPR
ncbi:MAG: hypothetical protein V1822_04115 [Candidatus Micrarchaeota archaeon]